MPQKRKSTPHPPNTALPPGTPPLPDTSEAAKDGGTRKIDLLAEEWVKVEALSKSQSGAAQLWLKVFTDRERGLLKDDYRELTPLALWQKVRGGTVRQAAVALCTAINALDAAMVVAMLKQCGESPYVPQRDRGPVLEAAIEKGGLVIVEGRREVHWKTECLGIEWFDADRQWAFLLELAKRARRGSTLNASTFLGEHHINLNSFSTIKMRLVQLEGFPADLKALIEPFGKKQYKLNLAPGDISIFSEEPQVVEVPRG